MNKPTEPPSSLSAATTGLRGKKKSAAEKVVEQTRTRAATTVAVPELPSSRLEYRNDANGKPTLWAIFPNKEKGHHQVDLSFLYEFPALMRPFAAGFLKWGRVATPDSRNTTRDYIRRYWFTYLSTNGLTQLRLEEIGEQVLTGFNTWLYGEISRTPCGKPRGKPLSLGTIRSALGNLRVVARNLESGRFLAELIPKGPLGTARSAKPTEILTYNDLLAVWSAVEKETLALAARWAKGRELLERGRMALAAGHRLEPNPGRVVKRNPRSLSEENLALCIAMLDAAYPGVIPDTSEIEKHNILLGRTIDEAFGRTRVVSYLLPSARDMVPLVLQIALATVFNPDTNLKLEWKNIDRNVDRLGIKVIGFNVTEDDEINEDDTKDTDNAANPLLKIIGDKPRAQANRSQVRLLDPQASEPSQPSLNLVLDLLQDMTKRIRLLVPHDQKDRIYLWVQETNKKCPKSFGSVHSLPCKDKSWAYAIRRFIKENKLPYFTLSTIRGTLLNFTQLRNRGDLEKARQLGNHSRAITTWTHYTSDLVKKLLTESTGEILKLRDRWIDTNGVIDPRGTGKDADKGCATPGWGCLDPYDSPRKGQKKSRLCNAYGECPDCPLAMSRPFNSNDVRLWEALERAIYRSVRSMTSAMWCEQYIPVLASLKNLLASVPPQVLAESRKIRVELPDVG